MGDHPVIQKLFGVNLYVEGRDGNRNCAKVLERLGRPDRHYRTILVAGSNGKGSVATKLAKSLEKSGYKTGLFTSPHIESVCERIQVNGKRVGEEFLIEQLKELFELGQEEPLSFFDYMTLLALRCFQREQVDFAVLEVGLGGRLDATNVVNPLLSVITSISLEHTAILGDTIEEIAKEKAGIIKSGRPVIIGPSVPAHVIRPVAEPLNAPLHIIEGAFSSFDEENRAIARKACEVLNVEPTGLDALPPCRVEEIVPGVILDVAHNPAALIALLREVKRRYPERELRVVAGFGREKNIEECVQLLRDHAKHLHFVDPQHERTINPEKLGLPCGGTTLEVVPLAREAAKNGGEILLICGTFYLMKDARSCL